MSALASLFSLPLLLSPVACVGSEQGPANPVGLSVDPDAAPFYTYPPEVVNAQNNDELKEELTQLAPGDYAVVDVSATWCVACQDLKPVFDYAAQFDRGQHLWIRSENLPEDTAYPTSQVYWDNLLEGAVTYAGCWQDGDYFPKFVVVEALENGAYEVHLMRDLMGLFRIANANDQNTYDYHGTSIIYDPRPDHNELVQIEDHSHMYDD